MTIDLYKISERGIGNCNKFIHMRIYSSTSKELYDLVALFTKKEGSKVSQSQIIRKAIRDMHQKFCNEEQSL